MNLNPREETARVAPHALLRLLLSLMGLALVAACGGGGGGGPSVETSPCGDECPADQCQFGACVGSSNGADTGTDTGGGTTGGMDTDMADTGGEDTGADTDMADTDMTDTDMADTDMADTDMTDTDMADAPGCEQDDDCEEQEYCDGDGACAEGCREGGCDAGQVCDLETRACVQEGVCASDEDCGDDEVCALPEEGDEGSCVPRCETDNDCPGEVCDVESGLCVGATCDGPEDCEQGFYCSDETSTCEPGCDEDVDCGGEDSGFVCDLETNECVGEVCMGDDMCPEGTYCELLDGRCAPGCRTDDECQFGEVCNLDPRECRPGCREDDACLLSEYCDQGTLTCIDGCRDDASCDLGFECVLVEEETEDEVTVERQRCVPLLCEGDDMCPETTYCEVESGECLSGCRAGDGDDCPSGFVCDEESRTCLEDTTCETSEACGAGFFCDTSGEEPVCAPGCDSDAACPENQPCVLETNTCGCRDVNDCGDTEICSLGECLPGCEDDDDCGDGQYCEFDLGLCVDGCRDDAFEPNNTSNNALPIDPGSYMMRMCYEAQIGDRDEDCFSFNLGQDDQLLVDATFMNADGDLDMDLYNPIGQIVARSQTRDDNEMIDHTAQLGGSYTLCVVPQGLGFESDYALDLEVIPALGCLEDVDEASNNDTCADQFDSPQALLPGEELMLEARTICAGDEDFVSLELRAGQELTVTLERTSDDGELDIQIIGTDCTSVLARTETFDATRTLTFTPVADGVYSVRVYGELASEEGTYDLTMSLEAGTAECRDDFFENRALEPNETSGDASLLFFERNVNLTAEGLNLCQTDEDWYQLTLQQPGDLIQVTLNQSVNNVPLKVEILAPDATMVLAETEEDAATKVATTDELMSAGVYYVRVTSPQAAPETGVIYGMTVLVTAANQCIEDAYEPNNSAEEGALLGAMEDGAGTMCRDNALESDWYAVLVGVGDTIDPTITFEWDVAMNGPRPLTLAYLRGPGPGGEAEQKDFFFSTADPSVDAPLNGARVVADGEAGLWYVEIQATTVGDPLDYAVNFGVEAVSCEEEPDAFEENDSCANAAAVALFERSQGYLCGPDGDEDWFSVSVAQGQQLTAVLEHFHFDGNLELEVYEPGGVTLVDFSYNSGPNFEEVVVEDTTAGNYCFRVFGRSGLTQNRYTLETFVE